MLVIRIFHFDMSNDCALRTSSRGADEVAAQVPAYGDRHMLRSMTDTRRRTYEIFVAALEHDETERGIVDRVRPFEAIQSDSRCHLLTIQQFVIHTETSDAEFNARANRHACFTMTPVVACPRAFDTISANS